MVANPLLIEYLVNTVSGDYENIDFLRGQITQWPKAYQDAFSEQALFAAIDEAIKNDFVRAYKFNSNINLFEKCSFEMSAIEEYWFLKSGALGYPHNL